MIVALGIVATAAAVPAAAAPSERVAVIVAPASAPVFRSPRAAHGLLVVGEGATVSRRGALASLVRGEMGNAIVSGGLPGGKPLIALSRRPAQVTFYVALPPPGKHHNVRRYPIAVVGPGYHGLLTDTSTRLPGLISIADVAPSARALARGERPSIRSEPEHDPRGRLASFDRRLSLAHDSRVAATLVLVGWLIVLCLAALLTRAPRPLSRSLPRPFDLHCLGGRAQRRGRLSASGRARRGGARRWRRAPRRRLPAAATARWRSR